MSSKRLLLLSNSTNYGEPYLEYPQSAIKDFLGTEVRTILFIPYAGVRMSFDDYAATVRERFEAMGYKLDSIHRAADPVAAVRSAQAVAVGGGNTFHLLRGLYEAGILDVIRERVEAGVPYIGWSAGSNVACPTIRTTNDMPVVEPPSLNALGLVPFQINPHYTDDHPAGHNGETRAQRISEFTELNPGTFVAGLREGTILRIEGSDIRLLGDQPVRIFIKGRQPVDYSPNESLRFLLH